MLKNVEMKAIELGNDLEVVKKELKRVASAKTRMKCQKGRSDYEEKMTEILQEEQLLKEVRAYIVGEKKTVTTFSQDDVDSLTYDETIKAIKSIQSKKYHTRWLTTVEGDNDDFRHACKIEEMLKQHLATVKPIEDNVIKKTDLQVVIDTIEATGKISTEKILEMLKDLM